MTPVSRRSNEGRYMYHLQTYWLPQFGKLVHDRSSSYVLWSTTTSGACSTDQVLLAQDRGKMVCGVCGVAQPHSRAGQDGEVISSQHLHILPNTWKNGDRLRPGSGFDPAAVNRL